MKEKKQEERMNPIKTFCLYCTLLFASLGMAQTLAAQNLLTNPGFEDSGTELTGWREEYYARGVTEFTIDSSRSHIGMNCLFLLNKDLNDARLVQTVQVKQKAHYKISGWIKTIKVGEGGAGASLALENYWIRSTEIKGTTGDWNYVEFYVTIEQAIATLDLGLRLGGIGATNTGTVLFDDVSMEVVEAIPEGKSVFAVSENNQMTKPGDTQVQVSLPVQPRIDQFASGMQFVILFTALVAAAAVYCVLLFVKTSQSRKTNTGSGDR